MHRLILFFCCISSLSCQNGKQSISSEIGNELLPNVPAYLVVEGQIPGSSIWVIDPQTQQQYPAQKITENRLVFVPKQNIAAGSSIEILSDNRPQSTGPLITQDAQKLSVQIGDQSILDYAIETVMPADSLPQYYQRSGFIHPLKSLSGKTLTDGFPKGHTHQHGIFYAFVTTTYKGQDTDFWNQQDETGTVRHKRVVEVEEGPVFSTFTTELEHLAFVQGDSIIVLNETWEMKIFPLEDSYLIDWTSMVEGVSQDTLFIEEYHYGGAAFRGYAGWNVENNYDSLVFVLTNEGKSQKDGNHSRPEWIDMYGHTGGSLAGIAIMGHHTNFRHPQAVRIHPEMPYFCFAPMVSGAFDITPRETYTASYRLFVHDGEPLTSQIEAVYDSFQSY